MQRVLNQEEIDAIVQASRGLTSNATKKEKSVQSCDFRQAGQLSRELVQAVSGMYEGFARNLSQELGLHLPVAIQVLLVSVEQLTYKDFLVRTPEVTYFQGYFFRKPELLRAREIPANRVNYLRLLKAASREELDPRELENAIKGEASLCYRLLRYLNSPVFGFPAEIRSVRHALVMLGEREVRRWVRLATTLVATQSKSSDMVLSALVRARFCELLAPRVEHCHSDLFLVGLLSLMDAILAMPMAMVLEGIALDSATRAVLLGQRSPLSPIYELMLAQENARWDKVAQFSSQLCLRESFVAECHWRAMHWARQMTEDLHTNA